MIIHEERLLLKNNLPCFYMLPSVFHLRGVVRGDCFDLASVLCQVVKQGKGFLCSEKGTAHRLRVKNLEREVFRGVNDIFIFPAGLVISKCVLKLANLVHRLLLCQQPGKPVALFKLLLTISFLL